MERKIYNDLLKWKKDAYKPLLIYGSKQVGKTYSVIDFGNGKEALISRNNKKKLKEIMSYKNEHHYNI